MLQAFSDDIDEGEDDEDDDDDDDDESEESDWDEVSEDESHGGLTEIEGFEVKRFSLIFFQFCPITYCPGSFFIIF